MDTLGSHSSDSVAWHGMARVRNSVRSIETTSRYYIQEWAGQPTSAMKACFIQPVAHAHGTKQWEVWYYCTEGRNHAACASNAPEEEDHWIHNILY
jgi:hypothetical protein